MNRTYAGDFKTEARQPFNHSQIIIVWWKRRTKQTINTEHWKMNSVLTLEESFGEYLKQQREHNMYEFQTVIHLFQT